MGGGPDLPATGRRTVESGLERLRDALGVRAVDLLVRDAVGAPLRRIGRSRDEPRVVGAHEPLYRALLAGGALDGSALPAPILEELALAGAWAVPLRASGQLLGALVITPGASAPPGERARLVATVAATVLALWHRNERLFEGLRERAQALDRQLLHTRALIEVGRAVAGGTDADGVARVVVLQARTVARADGAALVSEDPGGGSRVLAAAGVPPARGWETLTPAGLLTDVAVDGLVLSIPLGGESGTREALVVVRRVLPGFTADDHERLAGLAQQAAVGLASARLVADLRREQEDRRRLAVALVEAQEQERARLARDIHDGPIQELVGLGLLVDALAGDLAAGRDVTVDDMHRAAAAARAVVAELRATIVDLHPLALAELGFGGAARSLAKRLEDHGVVVDLDVAAAAALPPERQAVGVRILQEALANVTRHADATHVRIGATRCDGGVEVVVEDDGHGFDMAGMGRGTGSGHLGLAGIRERASLAGGHAEITSQPGHGTRVCAVLPVDAPERSGGAG